MSMGASLPWIRRPHPATTTPRNIYSVAFVRSPAFLPERDRLKIKKTKKRNRLQRGWRCLLFFRFVLLYKRLVETD